MLVDVLAELEESLELKNENCSLRASLLSENRFTPFSWNLDNFLLNIGASIALPLTALPFGDEDVLSGLLSPSPSSVLTTS